MMSFPICFTQICDNAFECFHEQPSNKRKNRKPPEELCFGALCNATGYFQNVLDLKE